MNPVIHLSIMRVVDGLPITQLLVECGFFPSKSEAKKAIKGNGIALNHKKNKITDPNKILKWEDFHPKFLSQSTIVIWKGKSDWRVIRFWVRESELDELSEKLENKDAAV